MKAKPCILPAKKIKEGRAVKNEFILYEFKKSVHYNQSAVMKSKYNEKYVFKLDTDTEHVNAVCC